jgi:argininosuccinate lyase
MVKLKVPFREAHEIVGNMVKYCENKGIGLEDLNEEDYPEISSKITKDMIPDLSPEACMERRKSFGGTSIKEVERQIESGREFIKEI